MPVLCSVDRLAPEPISAKWVTELEENPDLSERLDAFVARFGLLQDTVGDKLTPELMRHWLEPVGPALDNLARMERLGHLDSVDDWVEARNLRNRLVHEYMNDPDEFAGALHRALELVPLLEQTCKQLGQAARRLIPASWALNRLGHQRASWSDLASGPRRHVPPPGSLATCTPQSQEARSDPVSRFTRTGRPPARR